MMVTAIAIRNLPLMAGKTELAKVNAMIRIERDAREDWRNARTGSPTDSLGKQFHRANVQAVRENYLAAKAARVDYETLLRSA